MHITPRVTPPRFSALSANQKQLLDEVQQGKPVDILFLLQTRLKTMQNIGTLNEELIAQIDSFRDAKDVQATIEILSDETLTTGTSFNARMKESKAYVPSHNVVSALARALRRCRKTL